MAFVLALLRTPEAEQEESVKLVPTLHSRTANRTGRSLHLSPHPISAVYDSRESVLAGSRLRSESERTNGSIGHVGVSGIVVVGPDLAMVKPLFQARFAVQ